MEKSLSKYQVSVGYSMSWLVPHPPHSLVQPNGNVHCQNLHTDSHLLGYIVFQLVVTYSIRSAVQAVNLVLQGLDWYGLASRVQKRPESKHTHGSRSSLKLADGALGLDWGALSAYCQLWKCHKVFLLFSLYSNVSQVLCVTSNNVEKVVDFLCVIHCYLQNIDARW